MAGVAVNNVAAFAIEYTRFIVIFMSSVSSNKPARLFATRSLLVIARANSAHQPCAAAAGATEYHFDCR